MTVPIEPELPIDLVESDLAVDRELNSISESFRFLIDVTPTNVEDAKRAFLAAPSKEPTFTYRDLEDSPAVMGARLAAVNIEGVRDSSLAQIFSAKRRELSVQLEMLSTRETPRFLELSLLLYGPVTPVLERQANEILFGVPKVKLRRGQRLDAFAISAMAQGEIDRYRAIYPDLSVAVEVRDDSSGVMVENGTVLIASTASVSSSRLAGLLAHEVGTHILTYINGSLQSLKLMGSGLAGYEETQEGLALIAEAAVGALTAGRLRQIAARVIAVRRILQGWSFSETHRELTEKYGYSDSGAFTIAMRVWRAGGLTKDAIYLRGLQDLVEYIGAGNDLESLWQGKMSLSDLPLTAELTSRGILKPPALLPHFLNDASSMKRLTNVAGHGGLHNLIGAET